MRIRSTRKNLFLEYLFYILLIIGPDILSASEKKGIGIAELSESNRVNLLNVSWYYTWGTEPMTGVPKEKFVPMISGNHKKLDEQLSSFQPTSKIPYLLAINEPDNPGEANLAPIKVAENWPKISILADKVSSPAQTGPYQPWLDKFMKIAKNRSLKFDFIAIHIYGPPDPNQFLEKIDFLYNKYRMPIWITEFGVADWSVSKRNCKKPKTGCKNPYSEQQVLDFMKIVLPELEKRSFVERYAWFGAGKQTYSREQLRPSRLFEMDGKLTPLGKYYSEFN